MLLPIRRGRRTPPYGVCGIGARARPSRPILTTRPSRTPSARKCVRTACSAITYRPRETRFRLRCRRRMLPRSSKSRERRSAEARTSSIACAYRELAPIAPQIGVLFGDRGVARRLESLDLRQRIRRSLALRRSADLCLFSCTFAVLCHSLTVGRPVPPYIAWVRRLVAGMDASPPP
jgi:hypothetical protein